MYIYIYIYNVGCAWRCCLRPNVTSRKMAGSNPDGVNEMVHSLNPSGRTVALGSTQPLIEISRRVKVDGA